MYGFGGLLTLRVYQAEHLSNYLHRTSDALIYGTVPRVPMNIQIFLWLLPRPELSAFLPRGVRLWDVGCGILRVQLNASA